MSKLIYIVEERFHAVDVEDLINGPYIDTAIVKYFNTEKEAKDWIEDNYIHFLNNDQTFVDLQIIKKEMDVYIHNPKETIEKETWVDAWVSKDMDHIHISGFTRGQRKEMGYYDSFDKRFYIIARLPRMINCRTSLLDFLKKKAKEVKIDK